MLDHISDAAASDGRMVVASGKPLRHMDYFSGKHFVLETRGIRLESWLANPQMWWLHNSSIPLGTSDLVMDAEGRMVAENIRFHREVVPIATYAGIGEFNTGIIADLYDKRVLRAASVQVFFTIDDMARMFETKEHVILPSSELIEWSLVTAPADREAVRLCLDGMGVSNQLASLIISEQLRENTNSAPVVVAPAPTENNMPTEDEDVTPQEFELQEDTLEAISLEVARYAMESPEFISAMVAAFVANPDVLSAIQAQVELAMAAAAPAPEATPTPDPLPARPLKLTVAKRVTTPAAATPNPVASAPSTMVANVPAQNNLPVNGANKATVRGAILTSMHRAR